MKKVLVQERQKLINRMNEEMSAIASSPTNEVEKFRLALLAILGGELKTLNDKIQCKSCLVRKVS